MADKKPTAKTTPAAKTAAPAEPAAPAAGENEQTDEQAVTGTTSAGKVLQKQRRAQKLSIRQIAQELNIREEYITAIENDDYAQLPGKPYVIGFVKAYGKLLGLNLADLVNRVEQKGVAADTLGMPQPIDNGLAPSRLLIFFTLAAGVVVLVGWSIYNNQQRPHTSLASPQAAETARSGLASEQTAPKPTSPAATPPLMPAAQPEYTSPVQQNVPEQPQLPNTTPPSEPQPVSSDNTSANTPQLAETLVQQPAAANTAAAATIRMVATSKVWVQVRLPGGESIFNKVLNPGQSYSIAGDKQAMVDIGKPEALEFYLDDTHLGHISSSSVIRNLPLSASQLQAGAQPFTVSAASGPTN